MKARRKAYAELEEPEDYFQFFDSGLPADAFATSYPPPASKSDRERAAAAGSTVAGSDDGSSSSQDASGIRRLLGRLKPNEPDPVDGELVALDEMLGDRPSHPDGQTNEGKDADAVSQLADIRRRNGATDRSDTISPVTTPDGDVPPVDALGAVAAQGAGLPTDSSVAIPSSLLQGVPDAAPGEPDDAGSPLKPDRLADVAATREAGYPSPTAATAQPVDGTGPTTTDSTGVPDGTLDGSDPFASGPTDGEAAIDTERRRSIRPVGETPASVDIGPDAESSEPGSPGELGNVADMSAGLRGLVNDLPGQDPGDPAENPFLRTNRVASEPEPESVPDFSTDPFSTADRFGGGSTTDEGPDGTRTPTSGSPASPPYDSVGPAESPGATDPWQAGHPANTARRSEADGVGPDHPASASASDFEPAPDPDPADHEPVVSLPGIRDEQVPATEPVDPAPQDPGSLLTARPFEEPEAPIPDPPVPEPVAGLASLDDLGTAVSEAQHPEPEHPEPEHPAPEHPEPEHPEPEHPAPEHPEPEHPASEHPAPEHPDPQHPEPEHPASEHPDPQHPEPEHPASEHPEPEKSGSSVAEPPTGTTPVQDVEPPESVTPVADTPPNRHQVDSYLPTDRHPLAAFADSDRHPLAAFARTDTSMPPGPQPPPIDDVFPIEPAIAGVEAIDVGVSGVGATEVATADDGDLAHEDSDTVDESPSTEGVVQPESPAAAEPEQPQHAWEPWEPEDLGGFTTPGWSTSDEVAEDPDPIQEPAFTHDPDPNQEAAFTHDPDPIQEPDVDDDPDPNQEPDVDDGRDQQRDPPIPEVFLVGSSVSNDESTAWGAEDVDSDTEESTARQPADTDARGSWIPPALRGIAPDAQEAAENLPRRRR